MDEDQIKEVLLCQDQSFRRLYEQHQEIEQSLSNLNEKNVLTSREEMAEKELKKRKLRLKDELYRRIIEYKIKMESHE
ncbi:MAG TPA: YdcH family protein [Candidatus Saccharicenans sp.]|nr:YdcH family protein [Candidatus Saccharicenans sp.]HRD01635.1 YdcH family protein [Candidatus Saccharicenans sp.]